MIFYRERIKRESILSIKLFKFYRLMSYRIVSVDFTVNKPFYLVYFIVFSFPLNQCLYVYQHSIFDGVLFVVIQQKYALSNK